MFCLKVASHSSAQLETWLGRKRETSCMLTYKSQLPLPSRLFWQVRHPRVHTNTAVSVPTKQKYRGNTCSSKYQAPLCYTQIIPRSVPLQRNWGSQWAMNTLQKSIKVVKQKWHRTEGHKILAVWSKSCKWHLMWKTFIKHTLTNTRMVQVGSTT